MKIKTKIITLSVFASNEIQESHKLGQALTVINTTTIPPCQMEKRTF